MVFCFGTIHQFGENGGVTFSVSKSFNSVDRFTSSSIMFCRRKVLTIDSKKAVVNDVI